MDTASYALSVAIGLGGEDKWVLFPTGTKSTELLSVDDPSLVITVTLIDGHFILSSRHGRFSIPAAVGPSGHLLAAAKATELVDKNFDTERYA